MKNQTKNDVVVELLQKFGSENPDGFTVSIFGTKQNLGFAVAIKESQGMSPEQISALYKKLVYPGNFERLHFGGWYDAKTKKYHYDLVMVLPDYSMAVKAAKEQEQLAFFDLENMVECRFVQVETCAAAHTYAKIGILCTDETAHILNIKHIKKMFKDPKKWYEDANKMAAVISETYDVELYKVAGIIASTSVQKQWSDNVLLTHQFLQDGTCGQFGIVVEKCRKIMLANTPEEVADILKGDKIRNFFWNIYQPQNPDFVTIDRWMLGWAGENRDSWHAAAVRRTKDKIVELARKNGILPNQQQAILWAKVRGSMV